MLALGRRWNSPLLLAVLATPGSPRLCQEPLFRELHALVPAKPAPLSPSASVDAGDVDGDGDLDLLVTSTSDYLNCHEEGRNRLYLNEGTGRLADASRRLPDESVPTPDGALEDFDGDGDVDVLLINDHFPNRLLLNDGTGHFDDASDQLPVTGNKSLCVAVGDLDGDGDPDALVGHRKVEPMQYYRNEGGAVFSSAAGLLPQHDDLTVDVELADFDQDGYLDAYVGNSTVIQDAFDRVYRNDGTGAFESLDAALADPPEPTYEVALGDADADGDVDVFACRGGDSCVALLLNDGSLAFEEAPPEALPDGVGYATALEVGDVDGDGDLDVALGPSYEGRLFLGQGDGTFAEGSDGLPPSAAFSTYFGDIELADFDSDGDLDWFGANRVSADRLYLGDGRGEFVDFSADLVADSVTDLITTLHDLDGDGDLDYVDASAHHGARSFRNDGSGRFALASTTELPSDVLRDVALGDVDGDGDPDLVLAFEESSLFSHHKDVVHANLGDGTFGAAELVLPAPFDASQALLLFDSDGDGDLDLLAGRKPDMLLENDGTGAFALGDMAPTSESTHFSDGDLDADGDLDVVRSQPAEPAAVLRNDDSDLASGFEFPLAATHETALADVDGDGDLDVYLANDGPNRLFLNAGGGRFDDAPLPADTGSSRTAAFVDYDADGDLDVVVGNAVTCTDERSKLYANDGSGVFTAVHTETALGSLESACFVGVADVDRDDDVDLLLACGAELLLRNTTRQLAWSAPPRVGKPLVLALWGPPQERWVLLASAGTSELAIPPFGTLFLDPTTLRLAATGVLDADGGGAATGSIPNLPSLVGASAYWQALVGLEPRFTNLEITTFSDL